jgi:hypothetical protein
MFCVFVACEDGRPPQSHADRDGISNVPAVNGFRGQGLDKSSRTRIAVIGSGKKFFQRVPHALYSSATGHCD